MLAPMIASSALTPEELSAERSALVLGTMTWDDAQPEVNVAALRAGLDAGITLLDTADIYGDGASERAVGAALAELDDAERTRLRVQTKCGIVRANRATGVGTKHYDSSPAHIAAFLAGSRERLGVETVDTLVIHRPDLLTDPETTVRAFLDAREAGHVGELGVSNLSVSRAQAYQAALRRLAGPESRLACVQVELGLHHRGLVEAEVLANHTAAPATGGAVGLGQWCRDEGVELQAWGPLGQGRYTGRAATESAADSSDEATVADTTQVVAELADRYGVSGEAVVLAWLTRLPWGVRPVIGTRAPERIAACAQQGRAAEAMTTEDWHRLWTAARGEKLP